MDGSAIIADSDQPLTYLVVIATFIWPKHDCIGRLVCEHFLIENTSDTS